MTALPYITLWFDVVYNTWVNDYGGPDQTFSSTVWTLGVLPWGPVRIHHWGLCKCMCGVFFVALSCHLDIYSVYLSPENYGSDISGGKNLCVKIIDLLKFVKLSG